MPAQLLTMKIAINLNHLQAPMNQWVLREPGPASLGGPQATKEWTTALIHC